jgi:hypothetical protein
MSPPSPWKRCPCICHTDKTIGWSWGGPHDNSVERYKCYCLAGFLPNVEEPDAEPKRGDRR